MNRAILLCFLIILVSPPLYSADESVSPSHIELPDTPKLEIKIEIPLNIEILNETKPKEAGIDSEHWGEMKTLYFGTLELDEKKGLLYTDPLDKEEIKGRKYYEHIYYGEMLSEITYRDEEGNLALDDINEVAIIKQRYNEKGELVEETSYNTDGALKEDWYGFAIYRWEYNSKNLKTQGAFYDSKGRLAKQKFCDVSVNCWNYNDNGNMVLSSNYDINGKLTKNILGVAATKYKYDAKNRQTFEASYGTDRELINNKDGFAILLNMYDDVNCSILTARYDKDLKPFEAEHICFRRMVWNSRNDWAEIAFYNAKGDLIDNAEKTAIIRDSDFINQKPSRRQYYDIEKNLLSEWINKENTGNWLQVYPENN